MINQVSLKQLEDNPLAHEMYVGGTKVDCVRSIVFTAEPDSVPKVELELVAGLSYDGLADIDLYVHPESVTECIKGIQFSLKMDDDFRDALHKSIKSVLDESETSGEDLTNYEIADRIIERVFFGDE